jgi:hypothetical protein
MAVLGKWSGGTVSVLPGTSYAAPAALFPTEDRNDGSAYTWTSSTSTLTLPSTIVADGYLIRAQVELEDASNGRVNILSKIVQATGTGTAFPVGRSSGYSRDNSEDRSYTTCWHFIDNPSASSTFQYQWLRDNDAPTGGTVRSALEVIPLYYSDWGGYTSSSTAAAGGVTPTIIPGFTGTDGTNITIASNVVTLAGSGKRYLCLGSWNFIGGNTNTRSQRWGGFRVDSVLDESTKSYGITRDATNDNMGGIVSTIIESDGTTDVDLAVYRGIGVANGEGGGDVDAYTTSTSGVHGMVFLELYDNCDVFKCTGSTNENIATTGPIDLSVSKVADLDLNDSASWTRGSDTGMNAVQTCDALFGANASAASEDVTSTLRFTGYAELTVNGTEDADIFDGNYLRGASVSEDCFGWGANIIGTQGLTATDDVGVSATELSGSEGHDGAVHVQAGWLGFWGINLDTMEEVAASTRRVFIT